MLSGKFGLAAIGGDNSSLLLRSAARPSPIVYATARLMSDHSRKAKATIDGVEYGEHVKIALYVKKGMTDR
eukprot:5119918-Prymnesium_polylepis.1